MSRMRKIYKKYERWVLLGLVILLLATFSITGAASCEGQGERGSWHLGGSYLVAPSERDELSDEEYDRMFARWANFQRALRMPTREFRNYVMGLQPDDTFKAAWAHHLAYSAGEAAGYRAGERQITTAVEDLVGFALMFRSRLPFSDVNYQQFLADNYEGSQADFREGVRQIVVKDQFLYPIINSSRYQITYADAFEAWKESRERVDLQSYALPAAPFEALVRKEEETRRTLGEQEELLRRVVSVAASVRRVQAKVESVKEQGGAYPATLDAIAGFNPAQDPWGHDLRYTLVDGAPDVRSAGPDGTFDTEDDVTLAVQEQLDTHAHLFDLADKIRVRRTATGAWPKELAELTKGSEDGRLPALTHDIKDGWDHDFVYTPAADEEGAPTLASMGPDGEIGTADDIQVTLDPDEIVVTPGAGLAAYTSDELVDAWDRPMRVALRRAAPPTWRVTSAGADGDFDTAADNLVSGNAREIASFFQSVRSEYVQEATREFETLFVHLPLVTDAAMKRLWEAYPQHRPTDEEQLFQDWRAYRGDVFYKAKDPADPESGHGAQLARDVAPDATPTLVPSKDIFPAELAKPDGDEPKDDEPKDDEPKDDEPKDDEPKDDEPKDDEPKDDEVDPEAEDRKAFDELGWREIVIRQKFFESLMNDILTRVRASAAEVAKAQAALARWEASQERVAKAQAAWDEQWEGKESEADQPRPADATDPKPEVPAELTFETVLADELGDLVASGADGTPPAIQYWKTPKPMTREEYEANPDFGTGLQFELNRLKEDGDYNNVPAQLSTRLTKVLVRRLAYEPQRQLEFDEVEDKVFDRWVGFRQMVHASERLTALQEAITEAEKALGSEATDEAKAQAAAEAVTAWAAEQGVEPIVESTGLFIGSSPPPAVEITDDMDAETKARAARRNLVWRQGYATVKPVQSRQDTTTAAPGSFGRRVLTDPVRDGEGTGNAYLIRVQARQFPSKHEFSPRRYTEYLSEAVFGDRRQFTRNLRDAEGRFNQALARWFDDMEWMQAKFDLQTNSELNVLEKRERR